MIDKQLFRAKIRGLSLALTCLLMGMFPTRTYAFSFVPMSLTIEDSGQKAIGSFRLTNDGKERIAVRVRVTTREMDEEGIEQNNDVGDAFIVFPSRFVLEPNTQRALKIQWKGGPIGQTEGAYRVIAEQVPVEFEEAQGSGITLLFRYVGALYVSGKNVKAPSIQVLNALGSESDGERGISLTLENTGGTHAIIADPNLTISDEKGSELPIPTATLLPMEGQNILAGSVRRFFLPLDATEIGRNYEAILTFNAER